MIYPAGQYVEIVAQAVNVGGYEGINGSLLAEGIDAALGASAYGAADVSYSGAPAASGQGEAPPSGQPVGSLVYGVFKVFNILWRYDFDGSALAVGFSSQHTSDREEVALALYQPLTVSCVCHIGKQQPQLAVQLVDSAVGFKPGTILWHSGSAHQACEALVTGAGIDVTFFHCYRFKGSSEIYDIILFVILWVEEGNSQVVEVKLNHGLQVLEPLPMTVQVVYYKHGVFVEYTQYILVRALQVAERPLFARCLLA